MLEMAERMEGFFWEHFGWAIRFVGGLSLEQAFWLAMALWLVPTIGWWVLKLRQKRLEWEREAYA